MRATRRNLIRGGIGLALALLAACGGSGGGGTPTAPSGSRQRVVVLGDSLAVTPTTTQNFVTELQAKLQASHPGWTITNEGVIGDTTANGVARLDRVLTADTAILVLELGANDGLQGIAVATVEGNLNTLVERTEARGIRVLLCGMQTLPNYGATYAAEFRDVFPRVAARYQIALVPFLLEGVALDPALNLPDGLHPNVAGSRIVAANVWPYLDALVSQTAK
jgi:acyl-CoA thioesterase-1